MDSIKEFIILAILAWLLTYTLVTCTNGSGIESVCKEQNKLSYDACIVELTR